MTLFLITDVGGGNFKQMKSMGICWPTFQGCLQMCRAVNMPVEGLAGVGTSWGKHAAAANGEMVQAEKRINRCDAVK